MRSQVIIILRDNLGRILLQLRDEKPQRYPNYWAFFGGGIEENETPERALKREIKEELGIDNIEEYSFFKKYELEDEKGSVEEYVFISPVRVSISELKLELGEGRGLAFFSCEEIKKLKVPDFERIIFEDLCNLS
jgi:8-oxo-dGTP diphosphatase